MASHKGKPGKPGKIDLEEESVSLLTNSTAETKPTAATLQRRKAAAAKAKTAPVETAAAKAKTAPVEAAAAKAKTAPVKDRKEYQNQYYLKQKKKKEAEREAVARREAEEREAVARREAETRALAEHKRQVSAATSKRHRARKKQQQLEANRAAESKEDDTETLRPISTTKAARRYGAGPPVDGPPVIAQLDNEAEASDDDDFVADLMDASPNTRNRVLDFVESEAAEDFQLTETANQQLQEASQDLQSNAQQVQSNKQTYLVRSASRSKLMKACVKASAKKNREDRNGSPLQPRFLDALAPEENNGSPLRSDSKKPAEYEADSKEEANASKVDNNDEHAAKQEFDDDYDDDYKLTAKEAEDGFAAKVDDNDEFAAKESERENKSTSMPTVPASVTIRTNKSFDEESAVTYNDDFSMADTVHWEGNMARARSNNRRQAVAAVAPAAPPTQRRGTRERKQVVRLGVPEEHPDDDNRPSEKVRAKGKGRGRGRCA